LVEQNKQNPPKSTTKESSNDPSSQKSEAVWTFRGYRLEASEFTTAMVHLFRAEVSRANVWRQRLDTTTNWAVVTTGAAISIAFSQAENNPFVLFLNILLVTMFLIIEARRYRYYELWSYRVRLMETDFFAAMLVPPFQPSPDWAETLSENLLHPQFQISNWEAIGRRLRRNYIYIYTVLFAAWLGKLWLHPSNAQSLEQIAQRATVGPISGSIVLTISLIFCSLLIALSLFTIGLQEASGEVLPRFGSLAESAATSFSPSNKARKKIRAWFRPSHRRPQFLTYIITDQPDVIAKRIFKEMKRGVTSLAGTGMYTGHKHGVLMCALTITEVPHLKALVSEEDPDSFVIVAPAREVFGRGFAPLEDME